MSDETFTESFKAAGHQLVEAVKKLLHEGNVRRVIINLAITSEGESLGMARANITIRVANRFNRAASSFALDDTRIAVRKTAHFGNPRDLNPRNPTSVGQRPQSVKFRRVRC